jgi:ATP-dependent DNA helicase RecQ
VKARRERASAAPGRRGSGGGHDAPADRDPASEVSLDGSDARLFASLKALRSSIAREEQVPAYVVFSDRTLAELAARKPRTTSGFLDVKGVGQAKLEKYGERFLAAIRGADETEAA